MLIQDPQPPLTSRREKQRIEVLDHFRLSHWTDPELNRIVAMAAQICGTPVALITVVDRDRQWFKASHGVQIDHLPRAESFCAHALDQPGMCIAHDTLEDPRFENFAVVKGAPHVRFYAGAPLITHEGLTLGTLCVVDMEPRRLTDSQQWMLTSLARQVMQRFERQRRRFDFNLNEEGLLPPGLHDFTLPKLRAFVGTTPYRNNLWQLFLCFLAERVFTRQFDYAFISGGILGTEARPEAIDVTLQPRPNASPAKIDAGRALELFSVRVRVEKSPPEARTTPIVRLELGATAIAQQFRSALEVGSPAEV